MVSRVEDPHIPLVFGQARRYGGPSPFMD